MNSFIITSEAVTLVCNKTPYTISSSHVNYTKIIQAIKSNEWDSIPVLIDVVSDVKEWMSTSHEVDSIQFGYVDGGVHTLTYRGEQLHNVLVDKILNMMKENFPVQPMINLLKNLYDNPSKKAIDELYTFLEVGKMPITEDGCFLAYKRVNDNYTSCFDGQTDNSIGNIVSMPRHMVNDRSEVTCSYGLHVCSFDYLQYYPGARVVCVKVNPANVVSIPADYNNTKMRVCSYTVISELTPEEAGLSTHSFGTSVYSENKDNEESQEVVNTEPDTTLEVEVEVEVEGEGEPKKEDPRPYELGYSNGYYDGRHKISEAPDAELSDADEGSFTQFDIDMVNEGYLAGYKDGKGHKPRKYPKYTHYTA